MKVVSKIILISVLGCLLVGAGQLTAMENVYARSSRGTNGADKGAVSGDFKTITYDDMPENYSKLSLEDRMIVWQMALDEAKREYEMIGDEDDQPYTYEETIMTFSSGDNQEYIEDLYAAYIPSCLKIFKRYLKYYNQRFQPHYAVDAGISAERIFPMMLDKYVVYGKDNKDQVDCIGYGFCAIAETLESRASSSCSRSCSSRSDSTKSVSTIRSDSIGSISTKSSSGKSYTGSTVSSDKRSVGSYKSTSSEKNPKGWR